MRNVPLRRRLLLLALVGILPLATTAGIGLRALVNQQRVQVQQSGLAVTRALATAVDASLSESVSVLQALATSVLLDSGKPDRFYPRATDVMAAQPNWLLIHLADPSGTILLNTRYPLQPGSTLPDKESFDKVVSTLKPVVGVLTRGPDGLWGVPVRVPVVRSGKLRFVLTGVIKPDAILKVVDRQQVPEDWVVSVFDSKGIRVARSRRHEKYIGSPAASGLQDLMASDQQEGSGITHLLEGEQAYTAYSRARDTAWTVAIGIPSRSVDAAGYRSLGAYGSGILLSLAFAVVAAFMIARTINRPIRQLASATRALRRDELFVAVPSTDIREIDDLAKALVASAADAKEARQQAETASRAKDEFLAMLGHELRNPLAPIVTALHLMEIRANGAPDRERSIIERQVGHLLRLVNDLLDISRITRGKVELNRERIDLRTTVERALEMMQPALEKRTRPIDLDLCSKPVYAFGDATRLTQVLGNLIANAARHTPPDGRITIRVSEADGMAEVA
ncbi:MAG TPA: sensor histidine kinase, partial [Burkholderiales bacterium]|nr:sensor histidine kinase [Burkholderiales bacterium]